MRGMPVHCRTWYKKGNDSFSYKKKLGPGPVAILSSLVMEELLLPLPPTVFRYSSTEWTYWCVILPCRHAYIWNWVLVEAIELMITCIATILFRAVAPDLTLSKLAVFCIVVVPFLAEIKARLFAADLFVFAHQDSLLVCKKSRLLTSNVGSIHIRSSVEVGFVHVDGKQQIRILSENDHLLFGEQLTLEEQNCLLAEIREAYISWGMVSV
jgi:hypothetical protein